MTKVLSKESVGGKARKGTHGLWAVSQQLHVNDRVDAHTTHPGTRMQLRSTKPHSMLYIPPGAQPAHPRLSVLLR